VEGDHEEPGQQRHDRETREAGDHCVSIGTPVPGL
jgi:hypothetical protein